MPRYNVNASFTLETEIEVDLGYHAFDTGDTEEFNDESYFSTQSVEADGGNLSFVVEAEDEAMAEEIAAQVVYDGKEITDSSDLTWGVSNVSFDIEIIEIPMDLDRATTLVEAYLASMEGMDDDLKEAFGFLMDTVVDQERRIVELKGTITTLHAEVARLSVPEAVTDPETGIITTA